MNNSSNIKNEGVILDLILSVTEDPILVLNANGRIALSNRAAEDLLGNIRNARLISFLQKKDADYLQEYMTTKNANSQAIKFDTVILTKKSYDVYTIVAKNEYQSSTDNCITVIILKKKEERTNLSEIKERISRQLHEIKNSIQILDCGQEPKMTKHIHRVQEAIKELQGLSTQINSTEVQYLLVRSKEFITGLLDSLKTTVLSDINVDLDLCDNDIITDSSLLESIIINIILNARNAILLKKLTQEKIKGKIKIKTSISDRPKVKSMQETIQVPFLEIAISDNGIPLTNTEKIWEYGYSSTDGNGVGLYNVMQYVKSLGGYATVIPEASNGTNPDGYTKTFYIYLRNVQKKEAPILKGA